MEIRTFKPGEVQASHHKDGEKIQERDVFSPELYKILQI